VQKLKLCYIHALQIIQLRIQRANMRTNQTKIIEVTLLKRGGFIRWIVGIIV
jgi:hypothetical protein